MAFKVGVDKNALNVYRYILLDTIIYDIYIYIYIYFNLMISFRGVITDNWSITFVSRTEKVSGK